MIRALIFKFFFYSGTIIICIIFIPALILPQKIDLFGGRVLGYWIKFCLSVFLSVDIKIKGSENIPKNQNFFIASLHQSLFETFFLQAVFNAPVFILKKELLRIPVFGWHLKKIGSISIDRDKVSRENIGFYDKIKSVTNKTKRPVLIFPQATRTSIGDKVPFKKGVSKIYKELNFLCLPVALNSGNVWPKSGKLNSHRTITISILNSIPPGLNAMEFQLKIQEDLYNELEEIL
tara:strand:- start:765 stop:1466 length:702 start_codon:yes stop_codon:yes gene_type:complete